MDKVETYLRLFYVDMVNISQATDCIMRFWTRRLKFHAVYSPSFGNNYALHTKTKKFCKLLNNADLLTADGMGVVHASKILEKAYKANVRPGYDIARQVLQK